MTIMMVTNDADDDETLSPWGVDGSQAGDERREMGSSGWEAIVH